MKHGSVWMPVWQHGDQTSLVPYVWSWNPCFKRHLDLTGSICIGDVLRSGPVGLKDLLASHEQCLLGKHRPVQYYVTQGSVQGDGFVWFFPHVKMAVLLWTRTARRCNGWSEGQLSREFQFSWLIWSLPLPASSIPVHQSFPWVKSQRSACGWSRFGVEKGCFSMVYLMVPKPVQGREERSDWWRQGLCFSHSHNCPALGNGHFIDVLWWQISAGSWYWWIWLIFILSLWTESLA